MLIFVKYEKERRIAYTGRGTFEGGKGAVFDNIPMLLVVVCIFSNKHNFAHALPAPDARPKSNNAFFAFLKKIVGVTDDLKSDCDL